MNPTREESLFKLVLKKPAEERAAFVDVLSCEDGALRERIEDRLAAHEKQSPPIGFFEVRQGKAIGGVSNPK